MNQNDKDFIVQKIRTQYMEKDITQKELDLLRELDAEVKRPANVFGYAFGSIGAIIMGAGISLIMTDEKLAYELGCYLTDLQVFGTGQKGNLYHQRH